MLRKILLVLLSIIVGFSILAQQTPHNQYIIKLSNQSIEKFQAEIESSFPSYSFKYHETLSAQLNIFLVEVNEPKNSLNSALEILKEFPQVEYAQMNHQGVENRATPDDPSFKAQWNLIDIMAEKAWDITTGGKTALNQEIVVAVVDDGYYLHHDDLKQVYYKNLHEFPNNNIDDDSNGYVDDYLGWNVYADSSWIYPVQNHGTGVCGLVGAVGNNTTDMVGVNWNVKILPIQRVTTYESEVVKAYNYILEMRQRYNRTNGDSGAYIVVANSSFGVDNAFPKDYPIWCDMYDKMGKAGIINVGAGPNAEKDIDVKGDIPCTCPSPYLVTVTRTDRSKNLKQGGYGSINMDIGAPGEGVISTTRSNSVGIMSGTSFSAPTVSGAIALMYSAVKKDTLLNYQSKPDLLAAKIRHSLLTKGFDPAKSLDGRTVTGGILNLYRSVLAASDSTDTTLSNNEVVLTNNEFKIYPNPVGNELWLENLNQNIPQNVEVKIYGLDGVLQSEYHWLPNSEIDLSNLAQGMYVLSVVQNQELLARFKILKQ